MKASCTPCEKSVTVSFSGNRVAVDAPAQFGQFRFRNVHLKRTNRRCFHHFCELVVITVSFAASSRPLFEKRVPANTRGASCGLALS